MVNEIIMPVEQISANILEVRGKKVILDSDLAQLYGVTTRQLNQAVKRNANRFPTDFMFQLNEDEYQILRSQIVISRFGHGGRRYLPFIFTEHGAVMAASVLNTPKAIEVSVYVVRAFVRQRAMLASNAEFALKLAQMEKKLAVAFMLHEDKLVDHDNQLEEIIETIREMQQQHTHRPIGFRVEEENYEMLLLAYFKRQYGKLPFANKLA